MDPITAGLLLQGARMLITAVVDWASIAHAKGELSAEKLAEIKAKAGLADAEWDTIVAAAKARIAGTDTPPVAPTDG